MTSGAGESLGGRRGGAPPPEPTTRLTAREWDALGKLMMPIEAGGSRSLGPKLGPKLVALGYAEQF